MKNGSNYKEMLRHWSPEEKQILETIAARDGLVGPEVSGEMNGIKFIGQGRFTLCLIQIHGREVGDFIYGVCMYLPGERDPYSRSIGARNALVKACHQVITLYQNRTVTKRVA